MPDFIQITIIFLVSVFAGAYGSLAGGPSLVTIPTLIFYNVSPLVAIASNRMGLLGLTSSSWYKFHEMKKINYRLGFVLLAPLVIGSFIGVEFVLNAEEGTIEKIIAFFTLLLLAIFIIKPNMGMKELEKKFSKRHYVIGIILAFFAGIYGGFYGAGIGTFISYILIILFGQTFIQSAATNKMPIFFINLLTSIVFIISGVVVFWIAAVIFAGSFIGGWIGTAYSEKLGNEYIRWIFIAIVAIMALKLLLNS